MSYKQWSTSDDKIFYPAGEVVKRIPPGYYTIDESQMGIFFEKRPIKTQKLIRFPDAASDNIIEEIGKFWNLESVFKESDDPYKRGILLYGPPGSGKCVVKGTLIATSKGLLPIEELYSIWMKGNKDISVLSEEGHNKLKDVIDDGEKKSFKVTMNNGSTIEGSAEHRVRVISKNLKIDWKKLCELNIDDKIVCSSRIGPSSDEILDDNLAYFCGAITGDGGISVNKNGDRNRVFFVINKKDLEQESAYVSMMENCFGRFVGGFNGWIKNGKNVFMTNKTSNDFSDMMLKNNFLEPDKKDYRIPKRVPKFIMRSSLNDMIQFLSGIVDADGHISADKNCIDITLNSEGLIRDLHNICMLAGARANLSSKFISSVSLGQGMGRHKINKNYWRLRITSYQSFIKLKNLGFRPRISYKREQFDQLCEKDISTNVRTIIPYTQDGRLIKRVYEKLMSEDMKPGSRNTYSLFTSMSGKGVGVETIRKIQEHFPDAFENETGINFIIDNDCYFTGISKVEESYGHMYDLSVDGSPTYVVNGIISHNTCTLRIVVENLIKEQSGIVIDFPGTYLFKKGYEILREVHQDLPVIVLMEDVEAILQRHPESDVLNLLDGVYDINQVVFLATTNYPEKLGSRILNRPARFDKKILIGMPSMEAREIFIRSKLIDEDEKTVQMWVDDTDGMSIAHINELYIANRILGDSYAEAVEVLQQMKESPNSSQFDPHQHKEYALAEGPIKATNSPAYMECKKKLGGCITESAKTPSEIADVMTEDINSNNGLILG